MKKTKATIVMSIFSDFRHPGRTKSFVHGQKSNDAIFKGTNGQVCWTYKNIQSQRFLPIPKIKFMKMVFSAIHKPQANRDSILDTLDGGQTPAQSVEGSQWNPQLGMRRWESVGLSHWNNASVWHRICLSGWNSCGLKTTDSWDVHTSLWHRHSKNPPKYLWRRYLDHTSKYLFVSCGYACNWMSSYLKDVCYT